MKKSGEIIRELRMARKLSQQFLSDGIMSREALNKFELRNTSISSEKLFALLNRMNVSIDEYFIQIEEDFFDKKKEIEIEFIQIMNAESKQEEFLSKLNKQYSLTGDPYYHLKYCQYSLEFTKKNEGNFATMTMEIRTLKSYLNGNEHWGLFEFSMFTNCLFIFESEYIIDILHRIKSKMRYYSKNPQIKNELYYFYINALILFTERGKFDLYKHVLLQLKELSTDLVYMYGRISYLIFYKIYMEKESFTINSIKNELDILEYLGYTQLRKDIILTVEKLSF